MSCKMLTIDEGIKAIQSGKIVAYPTEGVYGLGCDPFNKQAVNSLIALKKRSPNKGLILIVHSWTQVDLLAKPMPPELLKPVMAVWPGPVTWIFPKRDNVPNQLSMDGNSIALRMTAHPVAKGLCRSGAIVSTSANISGEATLDTPAALHAVFGSTIAGIVTGALGGRAKPSDIFDLLTGRQLR